MKNLDKCSGKVPHFCLGAPLAKLEAEIALTSLFNKFSHIEKDPAFGINSDVQVQYL
ncbi:hypothetical protein D068_cds36290 [Bacillus atrophaeus UCMB-5137]|nr:hypothetical protein D068_cds36290 [Bacillus atrophaeus UCMB-5137]